MSLQNLAETYLHVNFLHLVTKLYVYTHPKLDVEFEGILSFL